MFVLQSIKKIITLIFICLIISQCSNEKIIVKPSGLAYIDNKIGTGREAKIGDTVAVHFKAWLIKNSPDPFSPESEDTADIKLGDSYLRNNPVEFRLSDSNFIRGSAEGINGMKKGGIRTMIIPAKLIYGNSKMNPYTPMDSSIKLIIELVRVK